LSQAAEANDKLLFLLPVDAKGSAINNVRTYLSVLKPELRC